MRGIWLFVFGLAACGSENQVGNLCAASADAGATVTLVTSPALECDGQMCLHVASWEPDMCTASCGSDDDCSAAERTPCDSGFACVVPFVTGENACRRMCVCRDRAEAFAMPAACL